MQKVKKFFSDHRYKILSGICIIAASYYLYQSLNDESNIKLSSFFQALRNNQLVEVVVGKQTIYFRSQLSEWYNASISGFPKKDLFDLLNSVKDLSFRCVQDSNQPILPLVGVTMMTAVPTYMILKYLNNDSQSKSLKKSAKIPQLNVDFNSFYGGQQIKDKLRQIIQFVKNQDKFVKMGARIRRGVLLYGPPGTGKTMLARCLASEAKMGFVSVCASQFQEIYVGVGPKRIRELFEMARNYPNGCIIFIDELDAIGSRKQGLQSTRETSLTINQLLTQMDGYESNRNIVIIGATNRIDLIDTAILRSGRFDLKFKICLPDAVERQGILRKILQRGKVLHQLHDHEIRNITEHSMKGWNGADIECAVNQAIYCAIARHNPTVTSEDLVQGTKSIMANK